MFSQLPDLTPGDSHSLWYTSSRNPQLLPPNLDPSIPGADGVPPNPAARGRPSAAHAAAAERSALARLLADEALMERRRLNVSNFGATWLKPPGVAKSLFQMREERREQDEHAEALRREQLAQELADAEAAGTAAAVEEAAEEGGEAEARDLDDEIPDADDAGFGFDGASDEDEDEDADDEDDADSDDGGMGTAAAAAGRRVGRELASQVATMRATEDRVRELMVRGQDGGLAAEEDDDGEEGLEDGGDPSQMLEEDDLLRGEGPPSGEDLDMDVDLDDDVPDAESGGYEHTDSEAEVSDDDGEALGGPVARHSGPGFAAPRGQQAARARGSLARSDATRASMDISSLLSRDGSSVLGSSPQPRRRN